MQRCEFCGSELPVNARFCGNCGHMLPDSGMTVTDITNPPATGIPDPQTPPLFSSPLYPNIQGSGMGWQDSDSTLRTRWSAADIESVNPQFTGRKTDENEAVLPDFLLPGMLAMQGQMPSPAQAPMVQAGGSSDGFSPGRFARRERWANTSRNFSTTNGTFFRRRPSRR